MTLRHENKGTGGGGGGITDINIISSRNTIDVARTGNDFDINVASEDSLRFIVRNYDELMQAVVDVGTLRMNGETISCVIQIVDDIHMTDAKKSDEEKYKVGNSSILDFDNKRFLFDWHLFYTTILCDGAMREIQLLYPETSNNLDTWQIRVNRFRLTNVGFGGGITLYNTHNGTSLNPQHANFSRYMLASTVNFHYYFDSCKISCCGADDNQVNKFIYEGNGNHYNKQYHTVLSLTNCNFYSGGNSGNNYWNNLNAPIDIYSILRFGSTPSNQRLVTLKQLTKEVNTSANETGCPLFQFSTVNESDPDYSNYVTFWQSHKWRVTSDGTSLVTSQIEDSLLLDTVIAVKDVYLQNPSIVPEGSDYASLVQILLQILQNAGGVSIETNYGEFIDSDYILYQPYGSFDNSNLIRKPVASLNNKITDTIGKYTFNDYDPNGDGRMFLVSECKPSNTGTCALIGMLYGCGFKYSDPKASFQHIYVTYCYGTYEVKCDMLNNSGRQIAITPSIVQYNNKYYIALKQIGEDFNIQFLGLFFGRNITPIVLYWKDSTQKWYSDRDRTNEVTFTTYASAGKMPASLDFGGTSSQAMAGDGSFLDWTSKLGYWTGTAQQYADLPADQKDIPNVLYVIQ